MHNTACAVMLAVIAAVLHVLFERNVACMAFTCCEGHLVNATWWVLSAISVWVCSFMHRENSAAGLDRIFCRILNAKGSLHCEAQHVTESSICWLTSLSVARR